MMRSLKININFFTILMIGCSATLWAVVETEYLMPILWLIFLSLWIIIREPGEFKMFFRRFSQIGSLLLIISILQIIFRRQGTILVAVHEFPIVFSEGLREAILLWIRFMIFFMLAYIFAQVSLFEFLLFLNKIRVSLQLSLLLLTTLKFIPFIFEEAKKALWALRFRGIEISNLTIRGKYFTFKKLLMPLLFRGIHYASFSSLALELRGYGVLDQVKIPQAYLLKTQDYFVLTAVLLINLAGIFFF